MKKIIFTIVFAFAVNTILAQTYLMRVKQGTVTYDIPINTIDEITFLEDPDTCGTSVTWGGETYQTVLIGSQCWFKENLNIGTQINASTAQTNNSKIEKYCYNNDQNNCTDYGGLYQWTEAMQYVTTAGAKGICPSYWHIPTLAEFTTLQTTVGGNTFGNALKAVGQGTGAGAGTNLSGFSALLAGSYFDLSFFSLGRYTYFWSSTEYKEMTLYYNTSDISLYGSYNEDGYSVRCLKD